MKVILLEDVKKVGKKGEVVEVSDGFARNMLIKKNVGIEATSKTLNDLKLQHKNEEKVAAQNLADAKELAALIETKTVTVKLKTG
jgi:large subunit ribosomal protein L9